MVMKGASIAVACAMLLVGSGGSRADDYRPGEFFSLDLPSAVLSPKPFGPLTEFKPEPAVAVDRAGEDAKASAASTEASTEPKAVASKAVASRAVASRAVTSRAVASKPVTSRTVTSRAEVSRTVAARLMVAEDRNPKLPFARPASYICRRRNRVVRPERRSRGGTPIRSMRRRWIREFRSGHADRAVSATGSGKHRRDKATVSARRNQIVTQYQHQR